MRVKATVLRIRRENVVVTKQIKLNKMEKRYCKKENKLIKKIVKIINVTYGIRTFNAVLKNINEIYSRVLPTEQLR